LLTAPIRTGIILGSFSHPHLKFANICFLFGDWKNTVTLETAQPHALQRSLGTVDVALLTVGSVIGSGIFLVPGEVLNSAGGSPTLALMAWVAGGIIALFGALTFSELGARRPNAGGLYIYIRDAFGRAPAFLFGLSLFVASVGGVNAALGVAFGDTVQGLFELTPVGGKVLAMVGIMFITVLNLMTAQATAMLQNVATLLRVGVLLAFIFFAFDTAAPSPGMATAAQQITLVGLPAIVGALVAVLWAYEGWQCTTYSAGEMRDPGRVLPRGLLVGMTILILLYLLVNAGSLHVLGVDRLQASKQPVADALFALGFPGLAAALRIFIGFSVLAAAHATLFTGSRVIYAMASDGLFIRSFATLTSKTKVPARGIIGCSVVSILFAVTNTFGELLAFVVVSNWMFFTLAAASLFVIRRLDGNRQPGFTVPLYPIIPILFIAGGMGIVISSWISGPPPARYGLILMVIGWIGYTLCYRLAQKN
jgi:basic amino acid/polyamine antiporter, APA family